MVISKQDAIKNARKVLEQQPKRLLSSISEKHLSVLKELFSSESFIERLETAIQLRKPLIEETPPWDDDPELAEMLDNMELQAKEDEMEMEKKQAQLRQEVKLAQKRYDDYINGVREETSDTESTIRHKRGSSMRRRSSFMSDSNQIEIVPKGIKKDHIPTTSTPHVPHRLVRMHSVDSPSGMHRRASVTTNRKFRRSSSVHFADEHRRNANGFDAHSAKIMGGGGEPKVGQLQRSNTKTLLKRGNTTILKPSPCDVTHVVSPKNSEQTQPKLTPVSKTGTAKSIKASAALAFKGDILPSKVSQAKIRPPIRKQVQTAPKESSAETSSKLGKTRPLKPMFARSTTRK